MQKKVGIVDSDEIFINRFKEVMNGKYEDLEVFIFPNVKSAQTAAKKTILDLLLVDSSIISNFDFSIPLQCKVAILTCERSVGEKGPLPTVCKYQSMEDWYKFICFICRGEKECESDKGGYSLSQEQRGKICLFIPGDSGIGANAAGELCHFLDKRGVSSAVLSPYHESGETIWEIAEPLSYHCDYVALYMEKWDKNDIVIPCINSDAIILISNGQHKSNSTIEKLLKEIPSYTGESNRFIKDKTYLLYDGFDPKEGKLIKDDEVEKLGGIDNERNINAAFEKLVIYLNV